MNTKLIFIAAAIASIILSGLQNANAQSWSLTGNAGTNPSVNFLGTTDAKPLVLRTKNAERMRILGSGTNLGYVGIGVSAPIQKLDVGGNINISLNAGLYINNKRVLNNTGTGNFFIGEEAGIHNTSGEYNTANGYQALYLNTVGYENTAFGSGALHNNIHSSGNTANGYFALYNNTSAYNTATGAFSMLYNTTGTNNTAIGSSSLYLNDSGSNNTATGAYTMYYGNGANNTANGYSALFYNEGINNTAIGYQSLSNNHGGSNNTAVGSDAISNTSAIRNTAIGSSSGSSHANGNYCTFIGALADANGDGYSNSTAVGDDAKITASNQIVLGDHLVTDLWAFGSIRIASDGRFKKNIKENVPGLDFIKQLRPVTYNYDIHKLNDYTGNKNKAEDRSIKYEKTASNKENILYTGFVAQEVDAVAKKLGYDFSGVYKPKNDKDLYGLSYSDFVVPLVKAVQELSTQNDSLKTQNEELQKRVDKIEQILSINAQQNAEVNTAALSSALLEQNNPNPFNQTTVIKYHLPKNTGKARINITDQNGRLIKTIELTANNNGKLILKAGELAAGTYQYTLTVNGRSVDTKKMVLLK